MLSFFRVLIRCCQSLPICFGWLAISTPSSSLSRSTEGRVEPFDRARSHDVIDARFPTRPIPVL
ncbi:hypothetical protein PCANC_02517 [Puccinia coronata f. sp. avenae]|uniref:Uncharacterized protein n=1 Tax=Puccinia coronata f. sp. avenae TaxID=200324 RepID=A0A2N5VYL8_9BASI|nr:hypothetical protein PCANC_02517 [Puccinia coronata f. sp. avenae]